MISLRSAMRPALENDHEFRGDFQMEPFEDIAAEDPMDHFEFDLTPVQTALEAQRPFSRRRQRPAGANVSLESASLGFWAALGAAIAAALVIIAKMLGWFTGGSSGGGGGGGGGGGSVAAVEKKIPAAAVKASAAQEHFKNVLKYAR